MAEVLRAFDTITLTGSDGRSYRAQACGGPGGNGLWEGWIEFASIDGACAVRTARETTQPNRTDLAYWASGLSPVYLDGALRRALNPVRVKSVVEGRPLFDGPAPAVAADIVPAKPEPPVAVLDPFSVYAKGEDVLRQELRALAPWHLTNIIDAYSFSSRAPADLRQAPRHELAELIIAAVRERADNEPISARVR
jgi:hypothetical protein